MGVRYHCWFVARPGQYITHMSQTADHALEKLVGKAGQLYTLPPVAMEVLRLSESDAVDVRLFKETIERDPALAAKLLRVVNSSLFGLRGQVSDLHQALALLGVEPLKMLVLGFCLPDNLFQEMHGEPLKRYWTTSLTRAVCARALAERFPTATHDEAFLAGLLRGLGQLVLVQQLGASYVAFLDAALDKPGELLQRERQTLGFDHTQLSGRLLATWGLPAHLAHAAGDRKPSGTDPHGAALTTLIDLAELMTQLVLDRRVDVLPELLEQGERAVGLTRETLFEMLDPLQQRVDQLAEALSLELLEDVNHEAVLQDAHRLLADLAEKAVARDLAGRTDDQIAEGLLAESHEVRLAVRRFLRPNPAAYVRPEASHQGEPPTPARTGVPAATLDEGDLQQMTTAAGRLAVRCRTQRRELSMVLLKGGEPHGSNQQDSHQVLKTAIALVQQQMLAEEVVRLPLSGTHTAVLMPGVERGEAVRFANAVVQHAGDNLGLRVRAGVAAIAQVPNRFEPARLVEGAMRCLSAALSGGATAVKSIEVY